MYSFVVLACLVASAFGAGCPVRPGVQDFDVQQYMGTWYEQERYNNPFETLLKCPKVTYELNTDGTVGAVNYGVNMYTGQSMFWNATGTLNGDKLGKMSLTGQVPGIPVSMTAPYTVVATDYTNYAIVTICYQQDFSVIKTHIESAWILTRTKDPLTAELNKQITQALTNANMLRSKFRVSSQSGC